MSEQIGKTKSQGWEIGVRRTFPISPDRAWELLMTSPGLDAWLGASTEIAFAKGATYITDVGTSGEVRGFEAGSLLRLTWLPPTLGFTTTLQLRVLPAKGGATISIHHEKLRSAEQREAMRQHWSAVLDALAALIKPCP